MSQKVIGVLLVCASLHCGGQDSREFTPGAEGEGGIEDGAEEPSSSAPGEDPGEVGSVAQAVSNVLPPFGWRPMSPSTSIGFAPRSDAAMPWVGHSMLVYGGRLADGSYSSELAGYEPVEDKWFSLSAAPLSGRSHAVTVWTGSKVYVWGGRNGTYRHMSSGGVYVPYYPERGRWFTIRSAPHILKCDPQGVWSEATQEMLLFGCTGSASTGYVAGGMAYKSGAQTWRELPAPPFTARIGARVVGVDGKMAVFGGGDPVTRAPFWDGGVYDPISNTWAPINVGVAREEAAAFGGEPRLYAALGLNTGRFRERASFWGGRPADGATAYDDGGAYNPTDLGWNSILSPGSALSESHRRYVSAWYGSDRLFIWGGQRYVAGQSPIVLGNGASWNAQSRTWSPMESGGPLPRAGASAAWTGSEAIVWGGFDQSGLLADGMIYHPTPRNMHADAIGAGSYFSCAFVEDGALECWGAMSFFSVDPGTNPRRPYVIRGLRASGPHQISLGIGHGCALVDGGGVVRCFGNNNFGSVGGFSNGALVVSLPRPAIQISSGNDYSCALLDNREVWCWGANRYGQVGNGLTADSSPPSQVSGLSGVAQISAGMDHTCAVLLDGTARCWGRGISGQLGDGTTQSRLTPATVVGLSNVVQIDSGGYMTCARKSDGSVFCWGNNSFGGLGQGTVDEGSHPTPLQVHDLSDAVNLTVGGWFACALRANGQPVCWGKNSFGQLGDGTNVHRSLPTPVVGLSGIAEIAVGFSHGCARSQTGQVSCWGNNLNGQIGDGTNAERQAPREVVW